MKRYNMYGALFTGLVTIFFMFGCGEDNPVDDDGGHFEAVGLILTIGGEEKVRYEGGTVTGQIEIAEDEESALYSITFIGSDGTQGVPTEEENQLDWELADMSVVDVVQDNPTDKWRFKIAGTAAGNTTITFKIMHDDHADFVSAPIPVVVSAAGGSAAFRNR